MPDLHPFGGRMSRHFARVGAIHRHSRRRCLVSLNPRLRPLLQHNNNNRTQASKFAPTDPLCYKSWLQKTPISVVSHCLGSDSHHSFTHHVLYRLRSSTSVFPVQHSLQIPLTSPQSPEKTSRFSRMTGLQIMLVLLSLTRYNKLQKETDNKHPGHCVLARVPSPQPRPRLHPIPSDTPPIHRYLEREYLKNYKATNIILLRPSVTFMLMRARDDSSIKVGHL